MQVKDSGMMIGKPGHCLLKSHPKSKHILDHDCWQALSHYLLGTSNDDYAEYVRRCMNK